MYVTPQKIDYDKIIDILNQAIEIDPETKYVQTIRETIDEVEKYKELSESDESDQK